MDHPILEKAVKISTLVFAALFLALPTAHAQDYRAEIMEHVVEHSVSFVTAEFR